jgi:hypothetical protein
MASFMTDAQLSKQKTDSAARARAAREERQRQQEQNQSAQRQAQQQAAACKLQRRASRWLAVLHGRPQMRCEWDAEAAAIGSSPSAGRQLLLCAWLLRFFSPEQDSERLRVLCRIIVDGMEQQQPPSMFASAALQKERALHWVTTLRKLLLCACRLLSPSEPHVAALLDEVGASAAGTAAAPTATSTASANTKKRLSVTFGPVLRLLLLLCEPAKWKLVTQLQAVAAGVAAAQALLIMAHSAVCAAAERLIASAGGLAFAVHAHADGGLMGAAVVRRLLHCLLTTPCPPVPSPAALPSSPPRACTW